MNIAYQEADRKIRRAVKGLTRILGMDSTTMGRSVTVASSIPPEIDHVIALLVEARTDMAIGHRIENS